MVTNNKKRDPLRFSIYAILTLSIIFLQVRCHREEVNPCAGKKRTTASFKVEEASLTYTSSEWDYETDTICTGYAQFTVTSEADSVIWKIGAGTYKQRSLKLNFAGLDKSNIPVTLIVFRKPQIDCFPDDKNSDTMTKVIYVAPSATKISGKFNGCWQESSNEKFTIQISQDTITYNPDGQIIITNLDKTGCTKRLQGSVGYKKMILHSDLSDCSYAVNASGYGELFFNSTNTITMTYGTATKIGGVFTVYNHVFNGVKIP